MTNNTYTQKKRPNTTTGCLLILGLLALISCDSQSSRKEQVSPCADEQTVGCVDGRLLHIPSPDWRDQIIYALMLDRFNDGDPSRNDQGVGVFDPSKGTHYSGGDIRGVIEKIEYIKELGATTVWTSPPIANQWWDPVSQYTGYHGYWPVNFIEVDKHYGSLDDYKDLSHMLHSNGMYLIQDAIVNHVGHFYNYMDGYNPEDTMENFQLNAGAIPAAPTMAPFDKINRLDPKHAAADIYNWTPPITDYNDLDQILTYQLMWLNDINTTNPTVRTALKEAYAFWIDAGIDGLRLDTVKHVELDFWHDFIHSADGVEAAARKTGREDFLTIGEAFNLVVPMKTEGEDRTLAYLGTPDKPAMKTMLNFTLYDEMRRVFNGGKPTKFMSFRLNTLMDKFPNPYIVPNFIDNHDVPRFITGGNVDAVKQAYTLIMSIPGIPVIYQGDEQIFTESRKAMFAGGYQSEQDHFDQHSEMYTFLKQLTQIRRQHKALSRGTLTTLLDNDKGAGVLAFQRNYEGQDVYIIINTSDVYATLLNRMPTGLKRGQPLVDLISAGNRTFNAGDKGELTLGLAPREILILVPDDKRAVGRVTTSEFELRIDQNYQDKRLTESLPLSGTISEPNATLQLVIDGYLYPPFTADENGRWQTSLPAPGMGESEHTIELYAPEFGVVSPSQTYASRGAVEFALTVEDPANDNTGPAGTYKPLTTAPAAGAETDIRSVNIRAGGNTLELVLEMDEISWVWHYVNGFQHVAFTLFFDFPNSEGLTDLPLLSASGPAGFKWDMAHALFSSGSNIYNTDSATSETTGRHINIEPEYILDRATNSITLRYKSDPMGLSSWEGVKIYITTWDRDEFGAYRPLDAKATDLKFGGGASSDPKIMDDILVEVPANVN